MDEPLESAMIALMILGLVVPFVFAMFKAVMNNGLKDGLKRALGDDDDFVIELDNRDQVMFRAKTGRPAAVRELIMTRTTNKGTYTAREWQVEVFTLEQLAQRTTLFIGLDGLTGALRNEDEINDVKIGDRAFDRRFKVGGSDADVVRGIFAHDDVKKAVRSLFDGMTVLRCALEGESLIVTFLPDHLRRQTGRQRIEIARRFADVLASASSSLALKDAARASGSVSSSSGSSVGVRIL